jgi:hypothetical protein
MDRFAGGGGALAERDQPLPFQDRHELLEAVVLLGPGAGGEAYACDLRNCVQVGPIRRGAGPRPLWRSTVAMVVAETSIPSFRSSPLIRR